MGFICLAILVSMILAVYRAIKGPTVYDRILSVNAFGTLTVVLITAYGFLTNRPDFLDLALVYALINFIGTIAVSKYVEFSHIGRPSGGDEQGDI
jgi:multicomponent Na+:H+ antiporter subunit F